jgi:hypothetical protein
LQIVPEEAGEIKITRVEWDLLEKFKCSFDFSLDPDLRESEKIFQYKVAEKSSEIKAEITLERDMQLPLIFNETTTGRIVLEPSAPIKNAYLICSHSHIFGF